MSEPAASSPGDPFEAHVPADPAQVGGIRRDVRTYLGQHGVVADAVDDIVLIVSELATNAVRASPHPSAQVGVRLALEPDAVAVEVEDEGGIAFAHDRPTFPPADATRGRGLAIVHFLARDVQFAHDDGHTLVRARYVCAPTSAVSAQPETGTAASDP